MYVQYDRNVPIHLRKRLPFSGSSTITSIEPLGINKMVLQSNMFPEINPGEYKRVALSITEFEPLEKMCEAMDLQSELIIHEK